jgi:hypothetical protein
MPLQILTPLHHLCQWQPQPMLFQVSTYLAVMQRLRQQFSRQDQQLTRANFRNLMSLQQQQQQHR